MKLIPTTNITYIHNVINHTFLIIASLRQHLFQKRFMTSHSHENVLILKVIFRRLYLEGILHEIMCRNIDQYTLIILQ